MIAGVVCEGATDFPILEAFLLELCPQLQDIRLLQPERSETIGSGGWTEVRRWCQEQRGKLKNYLSHAMGSPMELLVIHLDGDIAPALGVQVEGRTTEQVAADICATVKSWLGPLGAIPPGVIITIPMQSTEAWVLAAYGLGGFPSVEAIPNPTSELASHASLERDEFGVPYKDRRRYVEFAALVRTNVPTIAARCREARRFRTKIETICQGEAA